MASTRTTSSAREHSRPDPQDRYRSWPDLSFHYGLGWDEIRRMPRWLRRVYIEELPRLRAERLSESIDAATFHSMTKQSQKSILRRISRAVGQKPERPKSQVDAQQMAGAAKIAMKFVPTKKKGGDS